jgi:ketosteroid isomerase-like protein
MVTAKPSADLIDLTRQWRDAFRAGDESFAAQHLGHGEVVMLGSAPEDEEFRGRDNVLGLTIERAKQINDEAGISNDFDRELETEAWEAGDTGWVVTQGNWPMADGATIPTRSIAVYARDEDGAWKAVFSAAHVLVPNEALRPESPAYPLLTDASAVGST